MVAMVLDKAFPQACTPERLAYGPAAVTMRTLADAAQDVADAVLTLPAAEASLRTQCRRLHIFLYVRSWQALWLIGLSQCVPASEACT
jgi:hypothetical protein